MEKQNHGIISVSRVMSTNLNAVQLCSHLMTVCLGGSFAKKNEFADVAISGELITVTFTEDAINDLVNDVTKEMREYI